MTQPNFVDKTNSTGDRSQGWRRFVENLLRAITRKRAASRKGDEEMIFRVNVDYPTNRATVHKSSCPHISAGKKPEDGYWRSFETRNQGMAFAESTGLKAHACRVCSPGE